MAADVVERLLDGAVDLHVHPYPSPFPRRMDAAEAAQRAADARMRAIVVKSHHHDTAMDVAALREHGIAQSGIEVFGGIALNMQVGGLNPHAVNLCLAMGGKVVWFPTIASPAHIAHHREHPNLKFPQLAVDLIPEEPIDVWDDGSLRPEVHEILVMIAEADAVLASGHMPARSIIAVFEAAREAGVRRLIVNHPNFVIEASKGEVKQMAELGAVIEHSLCMYDEESSFHNWAIDVLVDWIRWVGPERSSLGSDLGQAGNPFPVDSFRKICRRLLEAGLTEREVRMLVADNPARLLGVDG
ncbi:MAG: SDR family oxidoreductase [Actinomycetota bacterium]|nr:SDR family oxidoreductase [Actinomycetota bacterium]